MKMFFSKFTFKHWRGLVVKGEGLATERSWVQILALDTRWNVSKHYSEEKKQK